MPHEVKPSRSAPFCKCEASLKPDPQLNTVLCPPRKVNSNFFSRPPLPDEVKEYEFGHLRHLDVTQASLACGRCRPVGIRRSPAMSRWI
jgi:hypothetical protein